VIETHEHTGDKTKLLHRVRRIRGQLNAVEKALLAEHECSTILLTVAACRGAMDSLMGEIIEDHVQFHILDPEHKSTPQQKDVINCFASGSNFSCNRSMIAGLDYFIKAVFNYPTLAECYKVAALDAANKLSA
jgi:DNA-binding FrmR family transcriptional regulator